jgi:uncharacterized protein YggE
MNRILLPLALVLPIAFAPAALAADEQPRPRISVTGEGEASVSPDMAILTLSVMREAETARAALDANNEAMGKVIAAMKEEGVEAKDLQTAGLAINPQYVYPDGKSDQKEPRITGYQVTNTLTVRVRDIAKVGSLLDRSVTLGVNQGGGIAFTNDDPVKALEEARREAVADAMAKAKTLAEAAGVELGKVRQISEHSIAQPPMPFQAKTMRMEAAAAAVPVEAGENTYHVGVEMVFGLKQAE